MRFDLRRMSDPFRHTAISFTQRSPFIACFFFSVCGEGAFHASPQERCPSLCAQYSPTAVHSHPHNPEARKALLFRVSESSSAVRSPRQTPHRICSQDEIRSVHQLLPYNEALKTNLSNYHRLKKLYSFHGGICLTSVFRYGNCQNKRIVGLLALHAGINTALFHKIKAVGYGVEENTHIL